MAMQSDLKGAEVAALISVTVRGLPGSTRRGRPGAGRTCRARPTLTGRWSVAAAPIIGCSIGWSSTNWAPCSRRLFGV